MITRFRQYKRLGRFTAPTPIPKYVKLILACMLCLAMITGLVNKIGVEHDIKFDSHPTLPPHQLIFWQKELKSVVRRPFRPAPLFYFQWMTPSRCHYSCHTATATFRVRSVYCLAEG